MTPKQLELCVAAFRKQHTTNFQIDTDRDQVTLGFRLLPRLTDDWRAWRRDWEENAQFEPVKTVSPEKEPPDNALRTAVDDAIRNGLDEVRFEITNNAWEAIGRHLDTIPQLRK